MKENKANSNERRNRANTEQRRVVIATSVNAGICHESGAH